MWSLSDWYSLDVLQSLFLVGHRHSIGALLLLPLPSLTNESYDRGVVLLFPESKEAGRHKKEPTFKNPNDRTGKEKKVAFQWEHRFGLPMILLSSFLARKHTCIVAYLTLQVSVYNRLKKLVFQHCPTRRQRKLFLLWRFYRLRLNWTKLNQPRTRWMNEWMNECDHWITLNRLL